MSWKMSGAVKSITHGASGQQLSTAEKLALLVLADYYREDLKCSWPSVELLAKECVCSERTLYRTLDSLETVHGLLKVEGGGGGRGITNSYRIVIPDRLSSFPEVNPVTGDKETLSPVTQNPVMGDTKTECILSEPILAEREEPKEVPQPFRNSKGQTPEEEERFRQQAEEFRIAREERRAKKQNKGRMQNFPARRPERPVSVGTAQSVLQAVKPPESWHKYAVEYTRVSDGVPPICQARDLATFADLLAQIAKAWEGDALEIFLEAFRKWAGKQDRWTKWSSRDFIETEAWPILETLDEGAPVRHTTSADVRREAEEFLEKTKKGA